MTPIRLAPIIALLSLAVASSGCRERTIPGASADGGRAQVEPVGAGPVAPAVLALRVIGTMPDGGQVEFPLVAGARPEVPAVQGLEIVSNLALEDYRIRLFDEADRAMISDDTPRDVPDAGLRYQIALPEPLKTGYRYSLVLDAQTGLEVTDAEGREHPDLRLEFQVAGDREKPAPPPRRKQKFRRHR